MQDDARWVKQTIAGDEQGFHRLIVKYESAIYRLILSRVRNHDDAQELTQEVFLKAYQKLPSLRKPEKFYSWLRQIAENQCQDWRRKRRSPYVLPLQDTAETPSADESLLLRETIAKVMEAIDRLPEEEKDLLKSRYLDDASYAELQAKHGLSYGAVAMRLLRAKQKIKEQLKKLLSGIIVFPWRNIVKRSLLRGALEGAKSVKVEMIIAGTAAVLVISGAGVLVWRFHQHTQEMPGPVASQTTQGESLRSLSRSSSSNAAFPNERISNPTEKRGEEAQGEPSLEEILEAIAWLDALETDIHTQEKEQYITEDEQTPELQRKVNIYAELAEILPEFRRTWDQIMQFADDEGRVKQAPYPLGERYYELRNRIVDLCEPFLVSATMIIIDGHSATFVGDYAIRRNKNGKICGVNLAPMFVQIAEYLGKELPFHGNPDYFAAEDYQGGTGGW